MSCCIRRLRRLCLPLYICRDEEEGEGVCRLCVSFILAACAVYICRCVTAGDGIVHVCRVVTVAYVCRLCVSFRVCREEQEEEEKRRRRRGGEEWTGH